MTSALDEMAKGFAPNALIIIPKTKYLPTKAKSQIWNPKAMVEF